MEQQTYDVTGMTCSACSAHVEKAVRALPGVASVSVNLLTNSMKVEGEATPEAVAQAVQKAGYGAASRGAQAQNEPRPQADAMQTQMRSMRTRLWVSFGFLIPLMYISMGSMWGAPLPPFLSGMENSVTFALTQFLLTLPIVYVNRKYYETGFKTLAHGSPNMDSLIAIGSTAALVYGVFAIMRIGYGLGMGDIELVHRYHMDLYFESAAMILTLITLGKYLETRSKGKTSEAITRLMDLAPKTAMVVRDGQEMTVPVEQVQVGDVFVVRPGQSVPVDGVILEGESSFNEAAITGESVPVDKAKDDAVIAASVNTAGFVRCRATKVGQDTTLAQIIRLVEEASSSKAPVAQLADKIAGIFVPVVIGIAVVAAGAWLLAGQSAEFALSVGISVLVISCPCALGLATPVAIMVGTGKGAENGILIKSGEALQTAHSLTDIVLDKTGTITEGRPAVTDTEAFGIEQGELLRLAASLEAGSEHPLARAVVEHAKQQGILYPQSTGFSALFGKGVAATVEGRSLCGGNETLLREQGIVPDEAVRARAEQLAQEGKTPLLFADTDAKKVLGLVAVADTVKPTSRAAVQEMARMGIHVTMLTGDNARTAEAIQKQLAIPDVIAGVLPDQKEQEVARLQKAGRVVAMVGDGINDAPALARADVGIAIGAGTDVAIESADIVLMRSNLQDVVTAVRLSRAVLRNIKENLFWAFFYNSVGIPLAAGVLYPLFGLRLSPMFGAAAMSLSSVCVVLNALRLRRFRAHPLEKTQAASQEVSATQRERRGDAPLAHEPEAHPASSAPPFASQEKEPKQKETQIEKEKETMEKKLTLKIEGMMCDHCRGHVEQALNAVEHVTAQVNLAAGEAVCTLSRPVEQGALKKAVQDAGYTVAAVEE